MQIEQVKKRKEKWVSSCNPSISESRSISPHLVQINKNVNVLFDYGIFVNFTVITC